MWSSSFIITDISCNRLIITAPYRDCVSAGEMRCFSTSACASSGSSPFIRYIRKVSTPARAFSTPRISTEYISSSPVSLSGKGKLVTLRAKRTLLEYITSVHLSSISASLLQRVQLGLKLRRTREISHFHRLVNLS